MLAPNPVVAWSNGASHVSCLFKERGAGYAQEGVPGSHSSVSCWENYIAGNSFCKAWAFLLQAMLFAFEHHEELSLVCELPAKRQSQRSWYHVRNYFSKAGMKLDYMYWLKNIISFLHTPLAIAGHILFYYTGETWLWNINTTSGSHENIWGEHHALLTLFIESPLVHHYVVSEGG